MKYTNAGNVRRLLLILVLTTALLMAAACGDTDPKALESGEIPLEDLVIAKERTFIPAGVDGRRSYSFDSNSIATWINEEGDEIVDVMVRIDYADNPGVAVRDEQQWHIDFSNNRYKISNSFSFDRDGRTRET